MTDPESPSPEHAPAVPNATSDSSSQLSAAAPRRREPRVITPRGTPVSKCRIVLHTEYAQRVFYRSWDRLKADLYVLTVRTRSAAQDEAAVVIEKTISEAFSKARADLAADLERTEVLRDHARVNEIPEWDDRLETIATFSTPRAREFLALIQQMDQLLMLYDTLWLAGFAETADRVHRSQNWQRRLTKIANRLRELANRTRVGLARQAERTVQPAAVPSAESLVEGSTPSAENGAEVPERTLSERDTDRLAEEGLETRDTEIGDEEGLDADVPEGADSEHAPVLASVG